MFGKKVTDTEAKDSSGKVAETKKESDFTMKADVSLQLNLLIIGFELNFGAHAETVPK